MYANKVVDQALAWLGKNENDGSHREIIDVYNSHEPLARNYKMRYTDPWCATFVSAVAIKLGYTSIIPTECSCSKMIELFKNLGCWVEDENRTPNSGDILFYDWQDNGQGDNTGLPDHVGIVESVANGKIIVIEGNYSNSVKKRTLTVNGKYIRGYGVPNYDKANTSEPNVILEWQKAAIADGYKFPKYGADGEWGAECESVAKNAICKKLPIGYKNKNLTKIVQKAVGLTGNNVDGKFGNQTKDAVIKWQKLVGLTPDGIIGINSWKKLLGVK